MRRRSLCLALMVLAACSKPAAKVATDSTVPAPTAMTAAPISFADVAGTWVMQTMGTTSDSVLLGYELMVTADGNGSTITFPNRTPVPVRLTLSGDSVMSEVGPYESALRKGVKVTTSTVSRLSGSEMVGTGVARYTVTGPDSVLQLRMRGSRKP